jgi:hypothetical protein
VVTKRVPLGLRLLAIFFGFGTVMCALTIVLLLFPGTALDVAWRLNPEAQRSFQSLGTLSILLMAVVGISCGAAAIGLFRGAWWGRVVGLIILFANAPPGPRHPTRARARKGFLAPLVTAAIVPGRA